MKSAVTISITPEARGGPFVFWDDLDGGMARARALGFDAVEIFPPEPEAVQPKKVRPLLDKHQLQLAAIGTGAGWVKHKLRLTAPDAGEREKAKLFVRGIIDAAGAMGAPAIVGSIQGRAETAADKPRAIDFLIEAVRDLGEHARAYGVPIIFEFLNRYETNLVNDVAGGVKLIHQCGCDNVKLLADLFHMNIEEADLARAIRAGGHHIGHVHLADSNRRPAGLGHTDFAPIGEALRLIQYTGYVSAEAFAYPDSETAAKHTIEAYGRYFEASKKPPTPLA